MTKIIFYLKNYHAQCAVLPVKSQQDCDFITNLQKQYYVLTKSLQLKIKFQCHL